MSCKRKKDCARRTTHDARRVLVTAGPTREYIDPVRYISNDSSGQMGFAMAQAAERLGCKVTLIAGPVSQKTPAKVKRIDVVSAKEMEKEVMREAKTADLIIMAAAVADFGIKKISKQKIKKKKSSRGTLTLKLKQNPDILSIVSKNKKRDQVIVGFALETNDLERNAARKLREKGCDCIVANGAGVIGKKDSSAILISRSGIKQRFKTSSKASLAKSLVSFFLATG